MFRQLSLSLLVLLAGLALRAPAVYGDEPQIDAEAKKVIGAFSDYVKKQKAFSVDVASKIHSELMGQKVDMELTQQIRLDRPHRLAISLESSQPGAGAQIVADADNTHVYLKAFNKYAVQKSPENVAELFNDPILVGLTSAGNAGAIVGALISDDPQTHLLEGEMALGVPAVEKLEYKGKEKIDGVEAHHLAATAEPYSWDLWIDAGAEPRVRRFVPDLTKLIAEMAKRSGGDADKVTFENVVSFENWDTNPKFGPDTFAFTPPSGAEKVDSVMEMFGGGAAPQAEADSLLGKPAPAIELAKYQGGTFKLADHQGKDVVILDFWASWCGPCRRAMPVIAKVADEFKDRGVVFMAVNIGEDDETVEKFLADEELDIKVAMDAEGTVAQAYLANAIPQTVIVGKDGRVQVVHVGLSPNLESQLSKELEALVAGKDLAGEKQAEAKE